MSNNSQIKKGAILSYIAIMFNIIAGMIYTPWMVSQIGKSDYGLYVLVMSFISYFVMDFGLGQAIARFISKYKVEGDENKVNDLLGLTSKLYLFINMVILIILIILYFFIETFFMELSPLEIEKFKIIYVIAGVFTFVSFQFMPLNGIFISYERFVALKSFDLITKIATITTMVVALLLGYKLFTLVAVNATVGIIVIIGKLIYLSKTTSIKINFKFYNKELLKELFNFSGWMTVILFAQRLIMNIAPSILAAFSGSVEISIFSIGMLIEGYLWTFSNALNGLFLTKVSYLSSKGDNKTAITDLMIRVGRIQLLIVGLLVIGLVAFGKEFIILWMGADFVDSYYVMLLLVLPGIIAITQQIGSTYIVVEGLLRPQAIILLISAVIGVMISVTLVGEYGAIGAATGIFITIILGKVIGVNYIFLKIMNLNIKRFFKESHLKMVIPLGLVLLIALAIQHYFPTDNLPLFFVKAIILGMIYFVVMWNISMNIEEKNMIINVINKVKNS